jgi:SAM-dependent methyltransferase
MIPYEIFGTVYDKMGHDSFSQRMAAFTLDLLQKKKFKPHTGLDLCCGTGSAIGVFCDHGLTMSGLDRSPQMLAVARKKLSRRKVHLYRQELPRFDFRHPSRSGCAKRQRFDLVTCFFDSLNYLLSERDLKAAFRSTFNHLEPGGWFVFDMNTIHMLGTVFTDEHPFAGTRKDVAWIFENRKLDLTDRAELQLTFFIKSGRHWRRHDEFHRERAYPNVTIKRLLKEVGFEVRGFYRCFSFVRPVKTTRRICVAARRPT